MIGPFKQDIQVTCGMNLILDFTLVCAQTSVLENVARVLLLNYMKAVIEKKKKWDFGNVAYIKLCLTSCTKFKLGK